MEFIGKAYKTSKSSFGITIPANIVEILSIEDKTFLKINIEIVEKSE